MFKALGDPVRLHLLSLIASTEEICVCDLTDAFEVTGATISTTSGCCGRPAWSTPSGAAPGSTTAVRGGVLACSAACSTGEPTPRPPQPAPLAIDTRPPHQDGA